MKTYWKRYTGLKRCAVPAVAVLLLIPWTAGAKSVRSLISEGNRALAAGKIRQALEAYEKAGVDVPEAAEVQIDKAIALYKSKQYDKAADTFKQAALKAREPRIEALAGFGAGNCAFRKAERQKDSDLKKAVENYRDSVRHYQEALKLAPEMQAAAHNIEIARIKMKALLDEIKKREEQRKKQQQQQQKAAEKLKQLIKRQQQALDENRNLEKQKQQPNTSPQADQQTSQLGDEQKKLADDTQKLADNLKQQSQQQKKGRQQNAQPTASPLDDAVRNLDQAVGSQNEASDKLHQQQNKPAADDQEKALRKMRKALDDLSGKNRSRQCNRPQQQQGRNRQGQQKQQQQRQGKKGQRKQQKANTGKQEKKPEQVVPLHDQASDILKEEKKNKERRRVPYAGYVPVDKDW